MPGGLTSGAEFWPAYLGTFRTVLEGALATSGAGASVDTAVAIAQLADIAVETCRNDKKIMFVGNGGSAAIASHMAIDYTKAGGLRALCFSDGAALTCLGNDLGYENTFAAPIASHAMRGDLVIAISSSGRSTNILRAVAAARDRGCRVITMSGFDAANPLRSLGDLNFYLPVSHYGFVEIGHLTLCHAALDLHVASTSQGVARV